MFYSDKFGKNQEGIKKTPQLNRPIFGGRLKLRSFFYFINQRTIRLPRTFTISPIAYLHSTCKSSAD